MSHIAEEIASQPACWRQAAEMVAARRPAGVPAPGDRVAVVGCGTSLFVAQAYAGLREAAGQGETDAFQASEYPAGRRYDRVVAISRTGITTEIVRALEAVAPGTPTTVVTSDPESPAARIATDVIALPFAAEQSIVQTRFATTVLTLFRADLGHDAQALAKSAEQILAEPLPAGADRFRQLTFLGTGWTVGIANEAAHKLRETAQAWTESYPAMEYRHGAHCIAGEGSLVWFLSPPPDSLATTLADAGATVRIGAHDAAVELIAVQRLAVELAELRGLDPDRPRNLDRSVVLA